MSLGEPHGEEISVGAHIAAEEGCLAAGSFHQGHDESAKRCCCGSCPDVSWADP